MTAGAKRYLEAAKFLLATSHECNFMVFPAKASFHGTEEALFPIEATVLLFALPGQLEYVVVNIESHGHA